MSFSLKQHTPAMKTFISFRCSLGMWRENGRKERESAREREGMEEGGAGY